MSRITLLTTALMALALPSLFSTGALAQGAFDVVVLHEGAPKRGTIVETSKDKIVLEVTGVQVTVQVGDVKRVAFADAPAMLTSAHASIASGQLEDALEKLGKIDKGDIQRKIVEDEVDYYIAFCKAKLALAGGGDKDAAVRAMVVFAQNTGTFHYYDANEITGDLALSLGKADVAGTFYKNISAAPWPEYKVKAAVLEANAILGEAIKLKAQGMQSDADDKFDVAAKQYEKVMGANLNTPLATRQKEFAKLGLAKCLGNLDKAPEGIALCEGIITNGDSRDGELFSRAYNALGACHQAAGSDKDAQLAFLHVDLLFYQDPSQHAEALYHLVDLWKKDNNADRALKARSLLKTRYPGSVWASLAN